MALADRFIEAIKRREGYTPRATWDFKQHSVGYGTRARYPGEVIDEAEAERRFREEIGKAAAIVDRFAPGLDEGTRAALTSLTYNVGDAWTRAGLGQAIRSGDMDRARQLFMQYVKAGGETLPGLVSRRQEEASWFGNASGEPVQPQMASSAGQPTQAAENPPTASVGAGKGTDMDFLSQLVAGLFGKGGAESIPGTSANGGVTPTTTPASDGFSLAGVLGDEDRKKRAAQAAQNAMAGLGMEAPAMPQMLLPRAAIDLTRLRQAIASRSGFGSV